jgi:hypothetical protein
MKLVAEFQRRARECRELSREAMNDDHRTLILGMAETWEILARQRKAYLERNPEAPQGSDPPWRKQDLH